MKLPNKNNRPITKKAGSTEEMHMLSLWMPVTDIDKLRVIAAEDKTTMSNIIRKLIKEYIG